MVDVSANIVATSALQSGTASSSLDAGALQGCLERRLNWPMRGFAAIAGAACLWPGILFVNIAGVAAVLGLLTLSMRVGHASPPVRTT